VGECAGVVIDLVATLLLEGREKLQEARAALEARKWAAAIYLSYSAQILAAKALLTAEEHPTNSHAGILEDFDARFLSEGGPFGAESFRDRVLLMNGNNPDEVFAREYLDQALAYITQAETFRQQALSHVS